MGLEANAVRTGRRAQSERGAVLAVAMLLLAAISAVILVASVSAGHGAAAGSWRADGLRARYAGESGLCVCAAQHYAGESGPVGLTSLPDGSAYLINEFDDTPGSVSAEVSGRFGIADQLVIAGLSD